MSAIFMKYNISTVKAFLYAYIYFILPEPIE